MNKIKISADFIITRLIVIFGIIVTLSLYIESKRTDSYKSGLYFVGIIFLTAGLIYFSTRSNAFFDDSNLYYQKLFKPQVQIPLKNIHLIIRNRFIAGRGIYSFEIKYLNETSKEDKIKFQTDSLAVMEEFKNFVKKINPFVKIV